MDKDITIAMIFVVPPTLASVAGIVVALINRNQLSKTNIKLVENSDKLTEIHTLTNSNLSKVTAKLDVANEKIDGLQKLAVSVKENKK